ncbi:MAG TPA: response regulator [Chitinophagales bacterium]|nr:response regulator [Chitinophagales bacterium]
MPLLLQNMQNDSSPRVAGEAEVKKYVESRQQEDPLTYIVEDDKANNFLCKMTLEEVGITHVRSFLRAELAIADLKNMVETGEEFPSLILLDINMPAMDGWAFLNEFRNFPEAVKAKTTIYLFSTSDHPKDVEKAQAYPEVLDFLAKPLSEEVANSLKEKYFSPQIAA